MKAKINSLAKTVGDLEFEEYSEVWELAETDGVFRPDGEYIKIQYVLFVHAIGVTEDGTEWAFGTLTGEKDAPLEDWRAGEVNKDLEFILPEEESTSPRTDLSIGMIARVLSHPDRRKLIERLDEDGTMEELDLAFSIGHASNLGVILDTHIPMLVDFGIVIRDGEWIIPTNDVSVILDCADAMEASITEQGTSNPV